MISLLHGNNIRITCLVRVSQVIFINFQFQRKLQKISENSFWFVVLNINANFD